MRVSDLMTHDVLSVTPETPIQQLVQLLSRPGVSGLPVLQDGRLVGIVSEADLLFREKPVHLPAGIAFLGAIFMLEDPRRTYEELRRQVGATARDLMSHPVVTVAPGLDVADAAQLMLDRGIKRLPVVEGDRLVGMLTRKDLVRALQA